MEASLRSMSGASPDSFFSSVSAVLVFAIKQPSSCELFAAVQPDQRLFSLADRSVKTTLLRLCRQAKVLVHSSPMASFNRDVAASSPAYSPGRAANVSMTRTRSRHARSGSASRRVKENPSPCLRPSSSRRAAAPFSANMVWRRSGSSALFGHCRFEHQIAQFAPPSPRSAGGPRSPRHDRRSGRENGPGPGGRRGRAGGRGRCGRPPSLRARPAAAAA